MGRTFLTPPTLPNLPSPPSNPSVGDIYFDTTLGSVGVYTSSGWEYIPWQGGGGGGSVNLYQTTIGNGTDTTYTITHNLGTENVEVSLTLISTGEKIGARVRILNQNQISVSFGSPIGTNSVKVIVIG